MRQSYTFYSHVLHFNPARNILACIQRGSPCQHAMRSTHSLALCAILLSSSLEHTSGWSILANVYNRTLKIANHNNEIKREPSTLSVIPLHTAIFDELERDAPLLFSMISQTYEAGDGDLAPKDILHTLISNGKSDAEYQLTNSPQRASSPSLSLKTFNVQKNNNGIVKYHILMQAVVETIQFVPAIIENTSDLDYLENVLAWSNNPTFPYVLAEYIYTLKNSQTESRITTSTTAKTLMAILDRLLAAEYKLQSSDLATWLNIVKIMRDMLSFNLVATEQMLKDWPSIHGLNMPTVLLASLPLGELQNAWDQQAAAGGIVSAIPLISQNFSVEAYHTQKAFDDVLAQQIKEINASIASAQTMATQEVSLFDQSVHVNEFYAGIVPNHAFGLPRAALTNTAYTQAQLNRLGIQHKLHRMVMSQCTILHPTLVKASDALTGAHGHISDLPTVEVSLNSQPLILEQSI